MSDADWSAKYKNQHGQVFDPDKLKNRDTQQNVSEIRVEKVLVVVPCPRQRNIMLIYSAKGIQCEKTKRN